MTRGWCPPRRPGRHRPLRGAAMLIAVGIGTVACSDNMALPEGSEPPLPPDQRNQPEGSLFGGDGGLDIFGGGSDDTPQGTTGIGVNSFLWRATLDTVSFLPITSADPFGGVIISDWYAPPDTPNERFKVNAYILDRTLRADGVRVSVFKQVRDETGTWVDAPVSTETATTLENTILTRARELRVAATTAS